MAGVGPGKTRVTLHDVARALGISVTQTSRALNGKWDVAERTRVRARAVADELGYVPNLEARRLLAARSKRYSIAPRYLPAVGADLRRRHFIHGSA